MNNIRNNEARPGDLERLHQHYRPGYESKEDENYITLTTHNAKADSINQNKLRRLPSRLFEFKAEIVGDFNEKSVPADMMLQLKPGAQIMFIKNDKGEVRRYFNGRIATISRIDNEDIYVQFPGETDELLLEKETWKNIRYRYNKEEDKIEEEELGTFKQYPIRLAWAITIHKSQGLTFEKAIIDAGASFAPGQVYVALSRLTTLDGLILYSRIQPHSINTDQRVLDFTRTEKELDRLHEELQQGQKIFMARSLMQSFDWTKLVESILYHYEEYEDRQLIDKEQCVEWAKTLVDASQQQQELALKFIRQLDQLLPVAEEDNYNFLHQRVKAGAEYFIKAMDETIASIQKHIEDVRFKQRTRKYVSSLKELLLAPERKKQQLQEAVTITEGLMRGVPVSELLQGVDEQKKAVQVQEEKVEEKPAARAPKGETKRITLQLFREGNAIAVIAQLRNLAVSTIESHLASFIVSGEISISELVPDDKVAIIMKTIEELRHETLAANPIKEKLGANFSYGEIRAVLQHKQWLQQEGV